ncbi:hypothetical protein [Paenibacillus kobensis]|uniref:hypothetical protein n=1 Tax=Paenibacillus kobensis TaxID=59841 RepID=UPI000FD73D4F|nr:hypothetical protein [Paenibacillus kobensis]
MNLQKKGEANFGAYKRGLKELTKQLPADARRMTLNEVKQIVAEYDFVQAVAELDKTFGAPDFEGGSGVTMKQYWLDDEGSKKISVIVEQAEIYYEDGKQTELLN